MGMNKVAYLSIACDADPDIDPPYRKVPSKENAEHIWQGITVGIHTLRQHLKETPVVSKYGRLPVTWLLRSDRQIYELYGNADFCFRRFENVWKSEHEHGSEIGWHPHLYRWDEYACQWTPYLAKDDDLEILAECLNSLRQCTDIYAVRTGWDYHSNRLMGFFDREGLLVDASAIPGSIHSGTWFHNWGGTARPPYFPSKFDYRRPAESHEHALRILEMPVLVRSLSLPFHLIRFCYHNLRAIRSFNVNFTDWESARWQGVFISRRCRPFYEAVHQTLAMSSEKEGIFLTTYFHTNELLSLRGVQRFIQNLENLSCLTERIGYTLVPTTLSVAASLVKNRGLTSICHSNSTQSSEDLL